MKNSKKLYMFAVIILMWIWKMWELDFKHENMMLILSGSAVSVMESEVLGYKSPLYGRRTGQWQVQPLTLST